MKLVILGASGLVGWNLWQAAERMGHTVAGTCNRFALPGLTQLPLDREPDLAAFLCAEKPDAVVCCAAWSWVDGCQRDPDRALRENRDYPAGAALAAKNAGARFLHFSTSYVFDGVNGPYDEEAVPSPISVYAASKLAGERTVQEASNGEAIIVRTMGVYGAEPQEKNFVFQVRRTLSTGQRMRVPSDQIGNATNAANLAEGVLKLLAADKTGIWNLAGPNPDLSRSDFAHQIAAAYGLDATLFDFVPTSVLDAPAPRPLHAGLLTAKAEAGTGWVPLPFDAQDAISLSHHDA